MYGGTILPGHCPGQDTALDAQNVMEVCKFITTVVLITAAGNRFLWGRADGY